MTIAAESFFELMPGQMSVVFVRFFIKTSLYCDFYPNILWLLIRTLISMEMGKFSGSITKRMCKSQQLRNHTIKSFWRWNSSSLRLDRLLFSFGILKKTTVRPYLLSSTIPPYIVTPEMIVYKVRNLSKTSDLKMLIIKILS